MSRKKAELMSDENDNAGMGAIAFLAAYLAFLACWPVLRMLWLYATTGEVPTP